MVDTVRTLPQLIASAPAGGEFTAQELRDFMVSSWTPDWVRYLNHRLPDETVHAEDDFFTSDTLADYTQVTTSGSAVFQIGLDVLSSRFVSQATGDVVAFLKPVTMTAPETIETAISVAGSSAINLVGLCFAEGTNVADDCILAAAGSAASVPSIFVYSGPMNALATAHLDDALSSPLSTPLFIRLAWKAANTWRAAFSIDGVTYFDDIGDIAFTMTPTHVGVVVSNYGGGTANHAAKFEYLRVYDADEITP